MVFDLNKIIGTYNNNQYERRIEKLRRKKDLLGNSWDTSNIESTVSETIKNIFDENVRSLVIYGEPQSGKTEMMVALTAKLMDLNKKHILILVTDNVKLRDQNLREFSTSGISPTPMDNNEFLRSVKESNMNIKKGSFIIFCKKNASELRKLIKNTGINEVDDLIIIDDEADYASPNSKINKDDDLKSVINELIDTMINNNGIWIGVTATPGRLDLNNSFLNDNKKWVYLPPHAKYYGQYHFFPPKFKKEGSKAASYNIKFLPEAGDDPRHLKEAVYNFMITVAHRNLENIKKNQEEDFYSMIIHTSTGKDGHKYDFQIVDDKVIKVLQEQRQGYDKILQNIYDLAIKKYNDSEKVDQILKYIWDSCKKYKSVIMNSDKDMRSHDFDSGTKPQTIFTFIFGGNIISRGLTFHGLLSMFFSRDSKHKLDIGTYIQRARMFGNREKVFNDFQLTIPEKLYIDWWTCFHNQRISLASINGLDNPLWFSTSRTKTTQEASMDKANVEHSSGEISWKKFIMTETIENIINDKNITKIDKIKKLYNIIGKECFGDIFYNEVIEDPDNNNEENIYIQNIRSIDGLKGWDYDLIIREKGGVIDLSKSNAEYGFAIFKNNSTREARLFFRSYINQRILRHNR